MKTLIAAILLLALLATTAHAAPIVLTWNASTTPAAQVTGYHVYKSPNMFAPFTLLGSTDNQTFTFTDPNGLPGECWRVTAYNTLGESQPTNNGCILTVVPMPAGGLTLQ